jgi:hypothetical protein
MAKSVKKAPGRVTLLRGILGPTSGTTGNITIQENGVIKIKVEKK